MLRTLPSIELLKHVLRARVCTLCHLRPPHSESLGPEVVRPCELACPVFVHLPALRKLAILRDPMIGSRAAALGQRIDQICNARPDAPGGGGGSPLGRYRNEVVGAMLDLVDDA
jgi:hypothetical protein